MDLEEDKGDDVSILTREDEGWGVMENDPSLQRDLCVYACVCVLSDFAFIILFFTATINSN